VDIVDLIRANVRRAERQAREILNDPDTVVLDCESTGLRGAYMVDLAVIAKGKTLINTLIDPLVAIPEEASAIHGIFDSDVKDAPAFGDVWVDGLSDILRTKRIVIYNAPYDIGVIKNELRRIEYTPNFRIRVDDAMTLYQSWYFGGVGRSGKNQTRLVNPHCDAPACIAEAEKHAKAAHRAYADCQATVRRLKMMAETCWLHDHTRKSKITN
jgi:DNA polymerase III subunit epsilon